MTNSDGCDEQDGYEEVTLLTEIEERVAHCPVPRTLYGTLVTITSRLPDLSVFVRRSNGCQAETSRSFVTLLAELSLMSLSSVN